MNNLTFNLSAGVWRWWFRNKKTLEPLSPFCYIEFLKNNAEMSFIIPEELRKNKDAIIFIERAR